MGRKEKFSDLVFLLLVKYSLSGSYEGKGDKRNISEKGFGERQLHCRGAIKKSQNSGCRVIVITGGKRPQVSQESVDGWGKKKGLIEDTFGSR